MKFYQLRTFRFALAASAVFGAILAVSFAVGLWVYRRQEISTSWRHLNHAATILLGEIKKHPHNPDYTKVTENFPTISVSVFAPNGTLVFHAGELKLSHIGLETGFIHRASGEEVRAQQADPSLGTVLTGESWEDHEASMHRIALDLILLFFPLVFAGGCLTYVAARRTFNPLDDLSRQAEEFSVSDRSARLSVDVEDEFGAFTNRLNRFLDRLQISVEAQEQFVADAAHELRTPLTVIRGQIETTLLRSRPPEEYQKSLETVLEEAERLSRLVELLLLSASPVEGKIEEIPLDEACQDVEAKWVDRFAQNGVTINAEAEPVVAQILPEEIVSILDNLLSNAIRFAPPNSEVTLTLTYSQGKAIFDCIDQGPGIPDDMLDKIFERFIRGEKSRNRAYGGYGIGLSVCKRLAEARGGSIKAIPNPNGAHLRLELPAKRVGFYPLPEHSLT